MKNLIIQFLIFLLSPSFFGQIINEKWEVIYNKNGLKVEIQFLVSENSCFNGLPTIINYRYNGSLRKSNEYVNWKLDYINCNDDEYVYGNGVQIGGASIIKELGSGFLEDVIKEDFDDQITNKKITSGLYNISESYSSYFINQSKNGNQNKITNFREKDRTYDIGISPYNIPNLSLDYISHFGENSCFYFTYDMSDKSNEEYTSIWMEDYRLVDLKNNKTYYATYTDLPQQNSARTIYRGQLSRFLVCFDRFPGAVKNFSLKEGECESNNFCFLNINLNNYPDAEDVNWRWYQNNDIEGTINFYINQEKALKGGEIKIYIEGIEFGSIDRYFTNKTYTPSCSDMTNANLTVRLEEGTYNYKAENDRYTWEGEFTVEKDKCSPYRLYVE